MQINKKDLQIINAMRRNSRESLTKLSRKTGIPVSTIFDRLKDNPFIKKNSCLLDYDMLGYGTRAKVTIKVARPHRNELQEFLLKSQNVNTLCKINSGYDFMTELIFKSVKDLENFMETMRDTYEIIEDNVFYVLDDLKKEEFMADCNMLPN